MIAKFTFNYNGGFEKKENAVFQQGSIGVDSYQVFAPFLTTTKVYIKTKRNGDLEFSLWKQLDYNSTIGGWLKTATQDELLVDGEMKVVFKFNNLVSQETSLWVRKGTLIVPEMTTYEALRDYVENQEIRIDQIINGTTDIAFDKTGTNLNSDFVEEAIKEVNTKSDANAQNIADMKDGTDAFSEILLGTPPNIVTIRYIHTNGNNFQVVGILYPDGREANIDEEMYVNFRNESGATRDSGIFLMTDGLSIGNQAVKGILFNPTSQHARKFLGVVTVDGVAVNAKSKATRFGIVHGIPTTRFRVTGTAYAEGQYLWATADGLLSNVAPAKPALQINVGIIINLVGGNADILVCPIVYGAFGDSSDVIITTPTNGDVAILGSDGIWRNSQRLVTAEGKITTLEGKVQTLETLATTIYDFKGSVAFESLPTTGQKVGDAYNITNNFTLGGQDYLAGTNVAWNGTTWDALASRIPNGDEVEYSDGVSVNEKIDEVNIKVDTVGINTEINLLENKTLNNVFNGTQILSKPSFTDGLFTGWIAASSSSSLSVIDQILNVTGTGNSQNVTTYIQTTKTPVLNDEYWFIAKLRVRSDLAYSINVFLGDNTVGNPMSMSIKNIISPIKDKWYIVSGLKRITTQSGQVRLYVDTRYASTTDATNSVLEIEYVKLYNTTEIGISTTETQLEYFYNSYEAINSNDTTFFTLQQINQNSLESKRRIFLSSVDEFDNVTVIPSKNIAYIDIVQIGNRTVYVQGKKYDNSYVNIPMVNVNTGLSYNLIGAVGTYQFVTKDFKEIKIYTRVSDERYCEIYYVEQYVNSIKQIDYSFEYLQVKEAKVISTIPSTTIIRGYRNGRLFANIGTSIVADDNDGNDNFPISIGTLPTADIKHLLIVENGNYVIVQSNGKILTSTNGTTWVEKVDMVNGVTQLTSHELFGSQTYKNIVLVSEYLATKTPAPSGYKAYLSTDSGITFTTCFNLEEQNLKLGTNYHLHAVKYDPYEDMLWAITGDGQQAQMVFYSKDMGTNWFTACKQGFLPVQATEIIPLQNCVLFSPDARLVAMLRYNRPKSGTQEGSELNFEIAKVFKESWGRSNLTEVPIASTAYIDYKNSIAYFGFGIIQNAPDGTVDDDLKRGNIFVTNGYDFVEIYKDTLFNSVAGVYGENEKVACRLHHENSVVLNVEENYNLYNEINNLRLNKANKTQSAWITVNTFQNSWSGTLKYRKNDFGELQIRATLTVGTGTINTTILAIPGGYFNTSSNTPIIAFNSSDGGNGIFRINVGGALVNGQSMTTGKIYNIAITVPVD